LQGLHGLQGFAAAQGLHGLQGLQGFFAALQGLHGLQGLQALQALHDATCATEFATPALAVASGRAAAPAARLATLSATAVFLNIESPPQVRPALPACG
jgi:hypothetical protein